MGCKFSFVIAVAPDRAAEVLNSIKKVDYPKGKYEIIVEKGLNPSNNRNRGAKKARGEIIAFIDDDAIVEKDILKNVEYFFSTHKDIDIVGGPQLTPQDDSAFAKASGYALSSTFGAWKMANRYSRKRTIFNADETILTSANLFCRKKVFRKISFSPRLFPGEDPDFISRARKENIKVAYLPTLIVYHRRRDNLWKLARQIYRYGETRPQKETLKETIKMPFFLFPSIFLIYLAIFFVFFEYNFLITRKLINFESVFFILFSLPLLIYILLDLVFAVINAILNKNAYSFPLLIFIYPTIHLSYGAGFLFSSLSKLRAVSKKEQSLE